MKNNYMDYYYDREAQALRCDTISFLMLEKGKLDHYFVDCINNGDEHGAEKTLKEINRLTKRRQNELDGLFKLNRRGVTHCCGFLIGQAERDLKFLHLTKGC